MPVRFSVELGFRSTRRPTSQAWTGGLHTEQSLLDAYCRSLVVNWTVGFPGDPCWKRLARAALRAPVPPRPQDPAQPNWPRPAHSGSEKGLSVPQRPGTIGKQRIPQQAAMKDSRALPWGAWVAALNPPKGKIDQGVDQQQDCTRYFCQR